MRSVFALAALAATAAAQAQGLVATLQGNSNLTSLLGLVSKYPTLASTLANATNITVLAPSNAAFTKFMASAGANQTLANDQLVQAILTYHVVSGVVNSSQFSSTPLFAQTLLTSPLLTNVTGGQRVEAINSTGATLISGLLSTSKVTQADIGITGGIVHVIDTILTPPAPISTTAIQLNLSSIAGALTTAGLVSTIDNARDLTVFAPNNAAFAAIASGLANASIATLQSVLGYHVVNGSVLYSTSLSNTTVTTLSGGKLTVTVANGSVFVNQAKVVIPNVLVANGVVHVIDSVLNPGNSTAAPTSSGNAFANATSNGQTPYTSGIPTGTASAPAATIVAPSSSSASGSGSGGASSTTSAGGAAQVTAALGAGLALAGALMAL